MKRLRSILLVCFLLLPLTGCNSAKTEETTFFAMDTLISISLPQDSASDDAFAAVEAQCRSIENEYSKTVASSVVARFNEAEQSVDLDAGEAVLLRRLLAFCTDTSGAFDPTVEPYVALYGIGTEQARVPDQAELAAAREAVGYHHVSLDGMTLLKDDARVHLDLGAAVKGYACMQAVELLKQTVPYGRVNFGGTVGVFGDKPDGSAWRIGIQDPRDENGRVGVLSVDEGFVAVSGDYERYFIEDGIRYHHIIDPFTAAPADSGLCCVAVYAQDGLEADVLSTALFVMGETAGTELYRSGALSFEAIFVGTDGHCTLTPGLAEMFTPEDGSFCTTYTVLPD